MRRWRPSILGVACCLAGAGAAWAQLPAGPEFRVNDFTFLDQRGPALAAMPDGGFVVAWTDLVQDGSDYGVFARRFSASGPLGAEFQVNTHTWGYQWLTAVSAAPDGRFMVAWTDQVDSSFEVRARAFSPAGTPLGPEVAVNTLTLGYQLAPEAGYGADAFLVAWHNDAQVGVRARLFDVNGSPRAAEFRVNTYSTGLQSVSAVAGWPGGFVVAWSAPHIIAEGNAFADVFVSRLDGQGLPVGEEFRVNTTTAGYQAQAALGLDSDGSFVVAWESVGQDGDQHGIFARAFAGDGTPLGPETQVNEFTVGRQRYPSLAADGQGGFVVTWTSYFQQEPGPDGSRHGVFGRRLARGARPLGSEFRVNTFTTGVQVGSAMAGLPDGRAVVTWTSLGQDGSLAGVFGQRYGAMEPVRLEVDASPGPASDGNGVLEPGESAPVAATWRNRNISSLTIGGGVVAFGGPGAQPYAVLDGTATYGTLAPDEARSCAAGPDCYAVSVPAMRPVPHWDARLDEDLSVARSGSWSIHVGDSFSDVPRTSPFYRFVETVFHHGVTGGCGPAAFCPAASTTREQMAVLLLAAREGAGYAPAACGRPNIFADVLETSPFCRWIEELARRGIVAGCGDGNFCPSAAVTREQMAVLVLRTLDPSLDPPPCVFPDLFADVPESSPYCRWIEELARRGIVAGCGGGNYCPAAPVTREQMSVVLATAFGLALYPA
jgi:hypothetical protein